MGSWVLKSHRGNTWQQVRACGFGISVVGGALHLVRLACFARRVPQQQEPSSVGSSSAAQLAKASLSLTLWRSGMMGYLTRGLGFRVSS